MKIATWNVNSLRARIEHVLNWLATKQPDILVLQETKVEDKDFPLAELATSGYQIIYIGEKKYNGVAVLSKHPTSDLEQALPGILGEQKRVLALTINDVRVINVYVPNGNAVDSDKYIYKLQWLELLKSYLQQQSSRYKNIVILGDFNIAPHNEDVYDPKAWEGQVLCSEPERAALQSLIAVGFEDTFRLFEQAAASYTWWDYRAAAFRRNMGLRIDHILASQTFAKQCRRCEIDIEPRRWERPSDHAPVMAEFEVE